MQDSDTGIDIIFNVSMHRVSRCIAVIRCIDFNNITYMLIILKVQIILLNWQCNRIGLKKKLVHFVKKLHFYTFKYRNISSYRDIFGAMH